MIEGVLYHCTEMAVDKNYVDTHGQSSIAFAFCYLLGFQLLPRLKPINRQKLYRPYKTGEDEFARLKPILTRPIRWGLIMQHYLPLRSPEDQGPGAAQRKPRLLSLNVGMKKKRMADRAFCVSKSQLPPRSTLNSPVVGPVGFNVGEAS